MTEHNTTQPPTEGHHTLETGATKDGFTYWGIEAMIETAQRWDTTPEQAEQYLEWEGVF